MRRYEWRNFLRRFHFRARKITTHGYQRHQYRYYHKRLRIILFHLKIEKFEQEGRKNVSRSFCLSFGIFRMPISIGTCWTTCSITLFGTRLLLEGIPRTEQLQRYFLAYRVSLSLYRNKTNKFSTSPNRGCSIHRRNGTYSTRAAARPQAASVLRLCRR